MSSIEDLIAAQRAQAAATIASGTSDLNAQLQTGNASLDNEQNTVGTQYDQLLNQVNSSYNTGLNNARESAASRGVYRSGILTGAETALGAQMGQQTSQYQGQRTQKLADIANRRSIMAQQTASKIAILANETNAKLGSTIADLRYKDYQQQEANKAAVAAAYAKSSSKSPTSSQLKQSAQAGAMDDINKYIQSGAWKQSYNTEKIFLPNLMKAYPELSPKDLTAWTYQLRKPYE